MELSKLQKECHDLAVEKGFWGEDGKEDRNQSELLMLVVTELGEACEALRKGNRQGSDICNEGYACDGCPIPDECWKKDTFEDEIADSVIRLLDLAQAMNIDLEWQIRNKLDYNKKRPYKHGKEF